MVVAHFGIAVALAGMAANAAFTSERLAVAKPGEMLNVGPWLVQLEDVTPDRGQELDRDRGASCARRRGAGAIILKPQTRYFSDPPTETNEAAIETFWNGQLYTVVGKPDASGGWQLRLWWKPFVTLIWARRRADRVGRRAGAARAVVAHAAPREAGAEWRKERYA